VKYRNLIGISPIIISALDNFDKEYDRGDVDYSATDLIRTPKQLYLYRKYTNEIEVDIADQTNRILGNAVHLLIAQYASLGMKELRSYASLPEGTISGKPDVIYLNDKNEWILEDHKVTSTWTLKNKERLKDFERQLNIYAYISNVNNQQLIAHAYINFLFRDWSYMKFLRYQDYPSTQMAHLELPLWSEKQQKEFIQKRMSILNSYKDMPIDKIPSCQDKYQDENWAVFKKDNKRATRKFDNPEDAEQYLIQNKNLNDLYIKHRIGDPVRCMRYCNVAPFCNWWQEHKGEYLK